jgi:microprocessor complex subunit DGCR8
METLHIPEWKVLLKYIKFCSIPMLLFPELVFNPAGKTEICILHEYAQHALRVQPKYVYKELG